MAVPVIEEYLSGSASYVTDVGTASVTLTTGAGTTAGWWLLAVQSWDFDTLAEMPAPSGSYSDWTHVGTADAGTNWPHHRVWVRKLDTGGAKSVTFTAAGAQSDNHCRVYVLSGVRSYDAFRVRGSGSDVSSTSHVADQTYCPDSDGLLIAVWLAAPVTPINYTLPGSLTAQTEIDSTFVTSRSGYRSVAAAGPTGALTATPSAARRFAAVQVLVSGGHGGVTFPSTRLRFRFELAIGADPAQHPDDWTWTDISGYVLNRDRMRITAGRRTDSDEPQASTCAVTLRNTGGRFSTRNPASPYYGLLRKNTPFRAWIDPGDGYTDRFSGFVTAWPPRWDPSGRDKFVPLRAQGILGRLGRGTPPTQSAWKRAVLGAARQATLLAYWPVEDDSRASSAMSGLPGGGSLSAAGTVDWASQDINHDFSSLGWGILQYGTQPLANLASGGQLFGPIPSGTSSPTGWGVAFWAQVSATASAENIVLARWATPGGTYVRWEVKQLAAGSLEVAGYNSAGTRTVLLAGGIVQTNNWYRVEAEQSGADVLARFYDQQSSPLDAQTLAGTTLGRPTRMYLNPDSNSVSGSVGFYVGHVQVWDTADPPTPGTDVLDTQTEPTLGYWREAANERLARLCAEDGVLVDVPPVQDRYVIRMDSQPAGTTLDLYQECARVDGGVEYEKGFGLAYKPRQDLYNPPVSMTVDYDASQVYPPFEPTDDDLGLRNDVTVIRSGGSSARYQDDDGPMGTDVVGPYEGSPVTLNISAMENLADRAAWEVHLGTVDEYRYPQLAVNFAGSPELLDDWLSLPQCGRVTIANPPADLPPETVDLIVQGYTEEIDTTSWVAVLDCSPASPWRVWTPESGTNEDRLDTAGSTLGSSVTSSATSLSVVSTGVKLWTTNAAYMPFDIEVVDAGYIAGERMTVTAISGASNPQTFTVTRSVNGAVMAHSAGATVRLWRPSALAL